MAITCTPNAVLAYAPCAPCLSNSNLLAVLALLMCHIQNGARADCDPKTLLEGTSCFECLSDHQMLVALVNIFYQFAVDGGFIEVGNLGEEAVCLACLPPKQLRAIILKFFCDYMQSQQS